MPVTPGSTLRISIWRAEATSMRSSEILMLLPDGTLEKVLDLPTVTSAQTGKWLRYAALWKVPADTRQTRLIIRSVRDAYGRYDDVEVIEVI